MPGKAPKGICRVERIPHALCTGKSVARMGCHRKPEGGSETSFPVMRGAVGRESNSWWDIEAALFQKE